MLQAGPIEKNETSNLRISQNGISLHLRIPSESGYLKNAVLVLREICEHFDLSPESTSRIVLALEEALLNSIEYGSLDESGFIDMQISVDGNEFVVVVEDHGPGILEKNCNKFSNREDILSDRGRGLSIINGVPDKTVIQTSKENGTRITMLFFIQEMD